MKGAAYDTPLISVVIATLNYGRFIADAVNSVLSQTYPAVELIVVDDGSTDETRNVLDGVQGEFTYHYQRHKGIGSARNAGVALSKGDFLSFLDADDTWVSRKLELQMDVFRAHPHIDAVYAHAIHYCSKELDDAQRRRLRHLDGRVTPSPLPHTMLIRRQSFERIGPFDETLTIGVDLDWYARSCDSAIETMTLDEVLYRRRLHGANANLTPAHEQSERLTVLKGILDRRRARESG